MENKTDMRMWLGILLIAIALFYKPGSLQFVNPKLEKPEAEIIELVEGISVPDPADSSKLAGLFNALSEKLDGTTLRTNLQVQYLMDFVGKNTFGSELMNNGKPKYPEFAPAVAAAMTKILGPQTETDPITADEKKKLARLFYGLSWKLYESSNDDDYESYKAKALAAIAEYNKDVDPEPNPDEDDCPCEGKGYIIHGDGHRTDCPCVAAGRECKCKGAAPSGNSGGCNCASGCNCAGGCKCESGDCKCEKCATQEPTEPTQPPKTTNPFGFDIPNVSGYRPRVGVEGMTVAYHLKMGARGQHSPVDVAFVDSLTRNQQYWLHDYLHGEIAKPGNDSSPTHRCQCVTANTYCNCVATYGKCHCPPVSAGSTTTSSGSSGRSTTSRRRGLFRGLLGGC